MQEPDPDVVMDVSPQPQSPRPLSPPEDDMQKQALAIHQALCDIAETNADLQLPIFVALNELAHQKDGDSTGDVLTRIEELLRRRHAFMRARGLLDDGAEKCVFDPSDRMAIVTQWRLEYSNAPEQLCRHHTYDQQRSVFNKHFHKFARHKRIAEAILFTGGITVEHLKMQWATPR